MLDRNLHDEMQHCIGNPTISCTFIVDFRMGVNFNLIITKEMEHKLMLLFKTKMIDCLYSAPPTFSDETFLHHITIT
jgi:hypothetical protein